MQKKKKEKVSEFNLLQDGFSVASTKLSLFFLPFSATRHQQHQARNLSITFISSTEIRCHCQHSDLFSEHSLTRATLIKCS